MENEKANPFLGYLGIAAAYTLLLSMGLLWPFDFHIPFRFEENHVKWITGTNGVEFSSVGTIRSDSSTNRIYDTLVSGTGLTLEIWAATQHNEQEGPARIISYSTDPGLRNFTLGQERQDLVMRLRTTETDLNGTNPSLIVKKVFHSSDPQHIVVTYDFSEENVYVNGKRRHHCQIPGGTFSNWDPSYFLLLGNEATGNRPWLGKLFLFAIYNRALSEKEIGENYMAGKIFDSARGQSEGRVAEGLVALYLFDEGQGEWVLDRSGSVQPINLMIPARLQITHRAFLASSSRIFEPIDFFLNIILFIPLGFLFHVGLRSRYGSSMKVVACVFILGTLFSFSIESLQYLELTRFSQMADVYCNTFGVALGIMIDKPRVHAL